MRRSWITLKSGWTVCQSLILTFYRPSTTLYHWEQRAIVLRPCCELRARLQLASVTQKRFRVGRTGWLACALACVLTTVRLPKCILHQRARKKITSIIAALNLWHKNDLKWMNPRGLIKTVLILSKIVYMYKTGKTIGASYVSVVYN